MEVYSLRLNIMKVFRYAESKLTEWNGVDQPTTGISCDIEFFGGSFDEVDERISFLGLNPVTVRHLQTKCTRGSEKNERHQKIRKLKDVGRFTVVCLLSDFSDFQEAEPKSSASRPLELVEKGLWQTLNQ